ncbi:hypothetical protein D3C87_1004950 [compost metagenome]
MPIRKRLALLLLGSLTVPLLQGWTPPEESCDFQRVKAHPDPKALLREYLRRDFSGEFESASPWKMGALLCPGHGPGWDSATIVASYSIGVAPPGKKVLSFPVTYQILGATWSDGSIEEGTRRERVVFVLVQTPYGWRIAEPQQNPHVDPRMLLNAPMYSSDGRRQLQRLVDLSKKRQN